MEQLIPKYPAGHSERKNVFFAKTLKIFPFYKMILKIRNKHFYRKKTVYIKYLDKQIHLERNWKGIL